MAYLQAILETLPGAVWVIDAEYNFDDERPKYKFLAINAAGQTLLGVRSNNGRLEFPAEPRIVREYIPAFVEKLQAVLLGSSTSDEPIPVEINTDASMGRTVDCWLSWPGHALG